jgi:hypothetical protein
MLDTLSGRLGVLLAAVFVAIAALLVGMSQHMPALQQLVTLGARLLAATIAFALLASLLVFNLLTRRLRVLARAVDAFRESRFEQAVRLEWARPEGDEIDRLAHAFGELAEQMRRQLSELQAMDAQRRELLANVSHDLRTPLTLMQGYLETLLLRQQELTAEEARSHIEVATRHAERLGRLVHDLFELTQLDSPGHRIEPEPFSLTELAQDVAQKFSLHAHARAVHLQTQLPAENVPVRGDIGLVERALQNLVENALRHTPIGGTVTIGVALDGARARLQVGDTGCGIAPEHLPHVFDRYFSAPRVEDARRHHAGLGLAIAKRIVALHGGAIGVRSTLGSGTVFSVEFPAASAGLT